VRDRAVGDRLGLDVVLYGGDRQFIRERNAVRRQHPHVDGLVAIPGDEVAAALGVVADRGRVVFRVPGGGGRDPELRADEVAVDVDELSVEIVGNSGRRPDEDDQVLPGLLVEDLVLEAGLQAFGRVICRTDRKLRAESIGVRSGRTDAEGQHGDGAQSQQRP
jgi:hypothetical protein